MSSPAQPLINWRNKVAEWGEKAAKPPSGKQDTSWHDEMVRKATETFTKPATAKVSSNSKGARKKSGSKKRVTKRVAGK